MTEDNFKNILDPLLKDKWIEALRSGKYEQCHGILRSGGSSWSNPERYCCLGVLADIAYPDVTVEDHYRQLSTKLFKGERYIVRKFIRLNDIEKKTFPEIADYIRENL
jgi:hypothetical protein